MVLDNGQAINLRSEAVPDVTFNRAIVEYCCRALALCTAAVSNAETLLILPGMAYIGFTLVSDMICGIDIRI